MCGGANPSRRRTTVPRINDLAQPGDPRRIRQQQAGARRPEGTQQTSQSAASSADRVDLSAAARQTQDLQNQLTQAAQNVPAVRADRVAQARARLASGGYDTQAVRQAIADRLMNQFGV